MCNAPKLSAFSSQQKTQRKDAEGQRRKVLSANSLSLRTLHLFVQKSWVNPPERKRSGFVEAAHQIHALHG
jgi:hypothetical protein